MRIIHGGRVEEFARAYDLDLSHVLDFSTNTNWLFPQKIVRDLLGGSMEAAFRYPDPTYSRLREALAVRHGVRPGNILPGNGATELIYLIARRFHGKKALIFAPAFSEYEAACRNESLEIAFDQALEKDDFVFWRPDHIEAIGLAKPSVVFIGNPNNPTGRLAAKDWLERLALACERHQALLVVDEAFMDFAKDKDMRSLASRASRSPHVLVMRSMTKIFSVPGLRIGYAVGHPSVCESLAKFQPTWSVNALAAETAIRLAQPARSHPTTPSPLRGEGFGITSRLDELRDLRQRFANALKEVPGFKTYPSDANFFLCRVDENIFEKQKLEEILGRKGILVRFCEDFHGLGPGCFMRLAARREEENNALVETLKGAFCYAR